MKRQNLRILVTGCTIDKIHYPQKEALVFNADGCTYVTDILNSGNCSFPVLHLLMLRDILEFDDHDRDTIAEAVINASEKQLDSPLARVQWRLQQNISLTEILTRP